MTPERWSRVKEVLQGALDRDSGERTAFLLQACGDDVDLRSHVEALLTSDENRGGFLETPAIHLAPADGPSSETVGMSPDEAIWDYDNASGENPLSRRVGSYRILREIGHGGMGTVYLAERADGQYRKRVAIKLVNPHLGAGNILRRFRNERQVLAALDHPNIAGLLDGGATEDGLPYLVMEYVDGVRIDTWCDSRKLPVRDRLKLFRKVCAAVQYAHEKQVIHRDIKPANILVTSDGEPALLDFGIAKVLARELSAETLETTAGMGPMTPEYASPEQLKGALVSPSSDIYALGVVLYQLLTGRLPHSIQGADVGRMVREVCELEPAKPSVAILGVDRASEVRSDSPTSLRRQLSGDLDNIVLKALRKEPARRYTSVAQFSDDLHRFLQDLPVRARRESLPYRVRKLLKRNRALIVAAALSAAIVLALVVGLGRFSGSRGGTAAIQSIAVLPLENLSHDPQQEPFVEDMTDGIISGLAKVRSLRVISRDSVMRYKSARKPAAVTARELNVSAVVEGSVLRSGDRVRIQVQLTDRDMDRARWSRTYDRELRDVAAIQSEAVKAIVQEIQVQLSPLEQARLSPSRPVSREAYETFLRGRYFLSKHTVEGFQKGLQAFQQAVEIDPAYGLAWVGLGDAYTSLSDMYLPPREAMPKAKAAAQRALAIDENLAEAHVTLATVQSQFDWDWIAAERSYKRALELNPSYSWAHLNYSIYLAQQGRTDEAVKEAEEANRLDPVPAAVGANLAWMLYYARRTDQSIALCRKILELEPGSVVTHITLGLDYTQKGMFEQAAAEYRRGKTLTSQASMPDGTQGLGYVYAVSGKKEQARQVLNELREISLRRHVAPYASALIYVGLGEKDKAFELLEKEYQERDEELLMLKVEPAFDPIRSDPRFKSLVRRIGLPP